MFKSIILDNVKICTYNRCIISQTIYQHMEIMSIIQKKVQTKLNTHTPDCDVLCSTVAAVPFPTVVKLDRENLYTVYSCSSVNT